MERSLISDGCSNEVTARWILGLLEMMVHQYERMKYERITDNLEAGGAASGVYKLSAQCMLWGVLIVAFPLI